IYDGDEPNPRSLGFVLANTSAPPVHVEINDLGQYSKSLFEALLHVQDDLLANDRPAMVRTATLDDLGIPTTHFELTEAQKLQLMQQGAVGTCAWLRDWRPEALEEAVRAQRAATPAR
ncbi:MAG TPA: hypothetical protein VLQ93_04790, partial [Myxococcaceae bacterium]|nr:hypothetical protein [Myxococcaceae bacterium]